MDHPFTYRLIRTRRRKKTLCLSIERDGTVVVRAPARVSAAEVQSFFNEKKGWVHKKLTQLSVQQRESRPKGFLSGEEFSFLGRAHPLVLSIHPDLQRPLLFVDHTFFLDRRHREEGKELFIAWYKEQAGVIIRERIKFYSKVLLVSPGRERITSAKRQWGCCSATNNLSFSWRLAMAPLAIIDYIVVHELAHIKEKNHSSRFWKIVESTLPDYLRRREWLRRHGHLLTITD